MKILGLQDWVIGHYAAMGLYPLVQGAVILPFSLRLALNQTFVQRINRELPCAKSAGRLFSYNSNSLSCLISSTLPCFSM
jgi:hypothetical protein